MEPCLDLPALDQLTDHVKPALSSGNVKSGNSNTNSVSMLGVAKSNKHDRLQQPEYPMIRKLTAEFSLTTAGTSTA